MMSLISMFVYERLVSLFVASVLKPLREVRSDLRDIFQRGIFVVDIFKRLHASSKKSGGGTDMMHRRVNDDTASSDRSSFVKSTIKERMPMSLVAPLPPKSWIKLPLYSLPLRPANFPRHNNLTNSSIGSMTLALPN
jgi:hypothetical protein